MADHHLSEADQQSRRLAEELATAQELVVMLTALNTSYDARLQQLAAAPDDGDSEQTQQQLAEVLHYLEQVQKDLVEARHFSRMVPSLVRQDLSGGYLSRYDEALTDLDHAIQLDPEDGWAIYESAVVLRLSGSEGAAERWHRVVEVFQAESVGEGRKAVWAAGNLLVVLCGLPDWQRAQEQVEVFLSASTSCHQIKEVLNDLADLRGALPVDASQLDPIVSRLEAALSQS